MLSGTILEPRRREIIDLLKSHKESSKRPKVLLVSTQVVEAGVDMDRTFSIYGRDLRYQIARDNIDLEEYKSILTDKQFDKLYKKVCKQINEDNQQAYRINLNDYLDKIKRLEFARVSSEFRLIDQQSVTVFVPLDLPADYFSFADLRFMANIGWDKARNVVSGKWVWQSYLNLVHGHDLDFIEKKINLKHIYGIMSQFMFSLYAHSHDVTELLRFSDGEESWKKYKMIYLQNWQEVYDYKHGLLTEKLNAPAIL